MDLLPGPGEMAADYSGDLPQDPGPGVGSDIPNLVPIDTSSLLQTPTTMPTASDLGDSAYTGISGDSSGSNPLDTSGIFGFLATDANAALNAFVIAPQNAKTAEGVANNAATNSLNSLLTSNSQIFSYLLIGLGIFLVVSLVGRK